MLGKYCSMNLGMLCSQFYIQIDMFMIEGIQIWLGTTLDGLIFRIEWSIVNIYGRTPYFYDRLEKTGLANFKIDEISTCISLLMSMPFTIRINLKMRALVLS